MKKDLKILLRKIPSIEKLISMAECKILIEKYSRNQVIEALRSSLDIIRKRIMENLSDVPSIEDIYLYVERELEGSNRKGLKKAINATGVVLHTNLGRAPLSKKSLKRLEDIITGYCTLEIDVETGKRGARYKRLEELLIKLTGSEGAVVVNNAASAVLLVLQHFTSGKEVIISRGELVEIGGGFRIPEIMSRSGCRLVEVGTTNRTRLSDYERAINENTAMILKVHTSNFKIIGFTESVPLEDLSRLAKDKKIPLFYDQGHGLMVNLKSFGIDEDSTVIDAIKYVELLAFSGDKLLGGPQAGIILGKREYLDPLKKDPLMRVLRADKMVLASLEATVEEYLYNCPEENIPVIHMLCISREKLADKAERLARGISVKGDMEISVIEGLSEVGGGTLPGVSLPTFLVSIKSPLGAKKIYENLCGLTPPVYGRIVEEQLLLDVRTIMEEDFEIIFTGLKKVF